MQTIAITYACISLLWFLWASLCSGTDGVGGSPGSGSPGEVGYQPRTSIEGRQERVARAIKRVREENLPLTFAAAAEGIPVSTLHYHVHLATSLAGAPRPPHARRVFTDAQEAELVQTLVQRARMLRPARPEQVRRAAYAYAKGHKIPAPFDSRLKLAGKDWLKGFMSRHRSALSFRKPQATSLGRATGFTKSKVQEFFDIYGSLIEQYGFGPGDIWNADETGFTVIAGAKKQKYVGVRGVKQFGLLTPAEREKLVSCVFSCNALGHYVPPFFIFPAAAVDPLWRVP
eukprot:GHVU01123826.1.p1 GENE.GHVU01123826.1~~GHVU01123826.1.p1  ORF type:complete len:287 (+),score=10.73 GHVU01123826.1:485-1345(+)